jgi:uncharacterized protein YbcC (UPF0753/DUF2309 family)
MPKDNVAPSTVSENSQFAENIMNRTVEPLAVRALVDNAAHSIAPLWPLRSFIARNPLVGFEEQSFEKAIVNGTDSFGGQGLPSRQMGQAAFARGTITDLHLRQTFAKHTQGLKTSLSVRGLTVPTAELLRVYMTTAEAATKSTPESQVQVDRMPTNQRLRTDLTGAINRFTIKWVAAFLDEGQSAWPMPGRQKGFYRAWKNLARFDKPLRDYLDNPAWNRFAKTLPNQPEQTIIEALQALQIPLNQWENHIAKHLQELPGWAGFIKWRSSQAEHVLQKRYSISLTDYVAVRLAMEYLMIDTALRRHETRGVSLQQLLDLEQTQKSLAEAQLSIADVAAFTKILSRYTGLAENDFAALTPTERQDIETLLTGFRQVEGQIWLEAWEESYRTRLLGDLAGVLPPHDQTLTRRKSRPAAQMVFCIDVRSEPFRRHLESLGAYETFGFAGFFGIPVQFTPFGASDGVASCPVLLQPKHNVTEIPRSNHQHEAHRHLQGLTFSKRVKILLSSLKQNIAAPFAFVETMGSLFGLLMTLRTLAPVTLGHWRKKIASRLMPSVSLQTTVNLSPCEADHEHEHEHVLGLSKKEQIFYGEASLRMMGLIENFAPLVVLCGHGSETINNPYAAGLDCGACGGNHGGPNARIMATIYNDPEVRKGLHERGIVIPDDTRFLAAEHNTTTDEITFYDAAEAAISHKGAIARLQTDLDTVRENTCLERYRKLGAVAADKQRARVGTLQRSQDWAQVRPEWGLAGNAAFIVGPRTLTQPLNLDGRCFLHSYDWKIDTEGKALEIILTAPLVVAEWINTQYYFSTVDNNHYGSGSKVTQNVTGKIGVMQGNASDLMSGLPLQSLSLRDGDFYHEPLRLMAVVYAPLSRVAEIIARNTILQHFFDNGWVTLTVIDPHKGNMQRYKPGKIWEDWSVNKVDMPAEESQGVVPVSGEETSDSSAMLASSL